MAVAAVAAVAVELASLQTTAGRPNRRRLLLLRRSPMQQLRAQTPPPARSTGRHGTIAQAKRATNTRRSSDRYAARAAIRRRLAQPRTLAHAPRRTPFLPHPPLPCSLPAIARAHNCVPDHTGQAAAQCRARPQLRRQAPRALLPRPRRPRPRFTSSWKRPPPAAARLGARAARAQVAVREHAVERARPIEDARADGGVGGVAAAGFCAVHRRCRGGQRCGAFRPQSLAAEPEFGGATGHSACEGPGRCRGTFARAAPHCGFACCFRFSRPRRRLPEHSPRPPGGDWWWSYSYYPRASARRPA